MGLVVSVRCRLRMEDELEDAGAIAQVDEDQPTVVAAAVDPARDARAGTRPLGVKPGRYRPTDTMLAFLQAL